ncbi:MAG: hypothetical protein CMD91_02780 [Gammaproteobacteria bacterium]|uniref:DUF502 domain-containing protein n=1 Tax=marine metagenome TaxID=408172 RepID=A0A381N3M7_9ZZZZ|nr:hypothetical protein [Gammaproteobacteria bacterium]|tara:strand:+ start:973 stop:1635 length:663 start_codon:yes stop_codon:yes gene_type:complete
MKNFRRYLIAGLLVWLPIGVTVFLVRIMIGLMDRSLLLLPSQFRPENVIGFGIPGLGFLLTIIVLLLTGVLAANFVGKSMVSFGESLLDRIPFVRSIYSATKNFAEIVFSGSGQSFKKVLLIEYPRKGIYSLAFQTSSELGEVQERVGEDLVCTFVPTTPNPTSGYIIVLPKKDIIELDMEVEQALKMIMSLGVVVPSWGKKDLDDLPESVNRKLRNDDN